MERALVETLLDVVYVPLNSQKYFYLDDSLYNSEQTGAKKFRFWLKLEFSMNFQSGGKSKYRAAEPAEREWVECTS